MTKMTGKMVEVLKMLPEKDWKDLFESLAIDKAMQLESRPTAELPDLKAEMKSIREVGNFFTSERQRTTEIAS